MERTRLFLGVVLIPLAVTCVFAAGVYSRAHQVDDPAARVVEARAVFNDRRGQDELPALNEGGGRGDSEGTGEVLHGGSVAFPGGVAPIAFAQQISPRPAVAVAGPYRQTAAESPSVRGPPRE